MLKESIGTKLRLMRFAKNITQKEVAEKLGININTVSAYENDKIKHEIGLVKRFIKLYNE